MTKYETVRDVIPDKVWATIPERAQALIYAGDTESITKTLWKPALARLRRKAKTGRVVNVKTFVGQEMKSALRADAFEPERLPAVEDAFIQKAQASFYKKLKGLPVYLKVAPRTFQLTDYAPQEAWDAFTKELVGEQAHHEDVMDRWLKRYVERWGGVPDVLTGAASRATSDDPKPTGRRSTKAEEQQPLHA